MVANDKLSIVGISPRNSYYTKANIGFVLDMLLQAKERILVLVPDVPDIHNYLAYGYEKGKARKKAHSFGQALRKTVQEICTDGRYSYADNGHALTQVCIINWQEEVENNPLYRNSLAGTEALYGTNVGFRHDIREASLSSIQSRMNYDKSLQNYFDETGIEKGVDKAVNYVLSEIAFLNATPRLFDCSGTDYIYHRKWPVYENFIEGKYDGTPRPELSLKIITNKLIA